MEGSSLRWAAILVMVTAFLFAGCQSEKKTEAQEAPVPVQAVQVKIESLHKTLSAVGSLSSPQETVLTSQVDGKVLTLNIRQGQVVVRNSLLATIDDSVQRAAVMAAEAGLFNASQIYERDRKVKDTGGISDQELKSAEAAMRQAEAQLKQARANLEHTRIRAPFTGALGLRQVSLGTFVKAGDAVVSLHQIHPLHLDFDLPQQDVSHLEVGQTVHFTVSGLSGDFTGRVTTVDPALASDSRTVRLQATVPNPDRRLKPGMFTRLNLVVGTVPEALFVPMQALVAEGQVNHVWVVGPEERAEQRRVEVGEYQDNWVQILSGLKPGERVVTAGVQKLRPGTKLQISSYEPIRNPRLNLSPPESKVRP